VKAQFRNQHLRYIIEVYNRNSTGIDRIV
jgi:hypothetical protein